MSGKNKWLTYITVASEGELSPWLLSAVVWQVRDWNRGNRVAMFRDPESEPGKITTTFTLTTSLKPHRIVLEAVRHLIQGSCPRAGEVVVTEITILACPQKRKRV